MRRFPRLPYVSVCLAPFTCLAATAVHADAPVLSAQDVSSSTNQEFFLSYRPKQESFLTYKPKLVNAARLVDTLETDSAQHICASHFEHHESICRYVASRAEKVSQGPIFKSTEKAARDALKSPSRLIINIEVIVIVFGLSICSFMSCRYGGRYWIVAVVTSSYILLIPGIFFKDFSLHIALNLPDIGIPRELIPGVRPRIVITHAHGLRGPIRESTRSLLQVLWFAGSKSGAVLVAFFAFLVPFVKLVLLLMGEYYRHTRPQIARRCILTVQVVSKWAAPDLFSYGLIYSATRRVHKPPLIESLQTLEAGMTCYICFCVASAYSSCFIPLPPDTNSRPPPMPLLLRCFGAKMFPWIVRLMAVTWLPFFVIGLLMPVICLDVDVPRMLQSNASDVNVGMLMTLMKLLHLDVAGMLNSRASVLQSAGQYWQWLFQGGELNLLVVAILMTFFVIAMTVFSVVSLLYAASGPTVAPPTSERGASKRRPSIDGSPLNSMAIPFLLKHTSFLDVCLMGIIIGTFATRIYANMGLVFSIGPGLYVLAVSEIIHYAMYKVVCDTRRYLEVPEFAVDRLPAKI